MDPETLERVLLVTCASLFVVIGLNVLIYLAFHKGEPVGKIEVFKRAADRLRQPWQEEQAEIGELARRVEALRQEEKDG
ncbi:MAG: hypothetical protein PHS96_15290 [Anaerolineales bacterium]|nr:hypothetical protein [Anaerolineales bacterium]